jgi:hypothetical protein
MAYVGQRPQVGNFVKIDDISAGFNGATQTFATTVSGTPYTVGNPYATVVGLGGTLLQPGVDYSFSGATISFAVAPTSANLGKFWCIVLGDVLTIGQPSNNSVTNAMLVPGTIQYSSFSTGTKATILANSLIFGA